MYLALHCRISSKLPNSLLRHRLRYDNRHRSRRFCAASLRLRSKVAKTPRRHRRDVKSSRNRQTGNRRLRTFFDRNIVNVMHNTLLCILCTLRDKINHNGHKEKAPI